MLKYTRECPKPKPIDKDLYKEYKLRRMHAANVRSMAKTYEELGDADWPTLLGLANAQQYKVKEMRAKLFHSVKYYTHTLSRKVKHLDIVSYDTDSLAAYLDIKTLKTLKDGLRSKIQMLRESMRERTVARRAYGSSVAVKRMGNVTTIEMIMDEKVLYYLPNTSLLTWPTLAMTRLC